MKSEYIRGNYHEGPLRETSDGLKLYNLILPIRLYFFQIRERMSG